MSQSLSVEKVVRIARESKISRGEEFADAVLQAGEPLVLNEPGPKKRTWHTYSVRLERFLAGEGPNCEGLEEFVEALDSPDDFQMLSLQYADKTWLAILEADNTLSAITTVEKPRTNR